MLRALWKFIFPEYLHAHYDTVRYAFPVLFFVAFIAGLAAVTSGEQSYVAITTDATTVARDQKFSIDVSVSARTPINAVDLQITYPKDQIAIDGIDTGQSVITLWTEEPYAKDGVIYLRGGTFRKGFVGDHSIAKINVHALTAGAAQLLIRQSDLIAGDGKGTPVSSEATTKNSVQILVVGDASKITGAAQIAIVTDTNGDGRVDITDITAFMTAWITHERVYDFNNDGRTTFVDFSIILADSFLH